MDKAFSRAVPLLGESAYKKLSSCRIAVFGLGGVGGYCLEALARSGVGAFDIVDNDVIEESNINRQLFALRSTVGQLKTHVAAERLNSRRRRYGGGNSIACSACAGGGGKDNFLHGHGKQA